MGESLRLTSPRDGFVFEVWREPTRDARRGGLVLLHAIWGVTPHLRALAGDWAEDGWEVLIPSLFDRDAPGLADEDSDPARLDERLALGAATGWGGTTTPDIQATIDALRARGPVCVMGFCFGGNCAWLAACRCDGVTAAASFYGGQVASFAEETPRCPTILHFGRHDATIPPEDVDRLAGLHPDLPIHLYDAGHAFVAPNGFHADSARLSLLRTRAFFHRAAGGKDHGA